MYEKIQERVFLAVTHLKIVLNNIFNKISITKIFEQSILSEIQLLI